MESVIRLAVAGSRRPWFVAALAAVITAALVIFVGVPGATVAAAPAAPQVFQCNPAAGQGSFPDSGAGFYVTCNVTVENSIIGGTSSTIITTACVTAAPLGPPTPAECASPAGYRGYFGYYETVTTSSQLVTSVNQCNGIVYGGGSNVICNVTVINDIPAGTPTSGVTVNQCNNSGTAPGYPDVSCVPAGSTSNATVNQCNYSGYGGGTFFGTLAVHCTAPVAAATALPVTINQCNGTAYGGGSTVTCAATITNNFVATPPTTTTTAPPTTTTTTTTTGPTTTTAPPTTTTIGLATTIATIATTTTGLTTTTTAGSSNLTPTGLTTTTATGSSNLTATGPTTTTTVAGATGVIPKGAPGTGAGGASHSRDSVLLVMGGLALFGAGAAMLQAIRRRRILLAQHRPAGDE